MKKLISVILAVMMAACLFCAAAADELPEPEGGKKFDTDWAIQNAVIWIYYEEEGYRVSVISEDFTEGTGVEWDYSCYYVEEEDALVSVSSSKVEYTLPENDTDLPEYGEPVYEGLDEEGMEAVFTIDENGRLIWTDPHENAGQDLEFIDIGRFSGSWMDDAEEVDVEFAWDGHDDAFWYDVWMQRGKSDADTFVTFSMTGVYNAETGKLECSGTATIYTKNAEGGYDITEDGETYDAFFSRMEDGRILFETENGIELNEYFGNQG